MSIFIGQQRRHLSKPREENVVGHLTESVQWGTEAAQKGVIPKSFSGRIWGRILGGRGKDNSWKGCSYEPSAGKSPGRWGNKLFGPKGESGEHSAATTAIGPLLLASRCLRLCPSLGMCPAHSALHILSKAALELKRIWEKGEPTRKAHSRKQVASKEQRVNFSGRKRYQPAAQKPHEGRTLPLFAELSPVPSAGASTQQVLGKYGQPSWN